MHVIWLIDKKKFERIHTHLFIEMFFSIIFRTGHIHYGFDHVRYLDEEQNIR